MDGSNTAGRIAELRKQIAADKGKLDRAHTTKTFLEQKMRECSTRIRLAQSEIRSMGGRIVTPQ